jgi:PAS domain S-box-containing protein
MSLLAKDLEWGESASATGASLADSESMFRRLFERSADAIFLFDPGREVFVDCNRAAVEMMRATSKKQLLMVHPANLSSEFQPDGQSSREKTPEVINHAISKGSHRFEWRARRMDGTEFPLEVLLTPIETGEHPLMATICRDITERKTSEQKILELNASLEQRVAQRTAALRESEEKFRALFEGSSQGVVLHDENQILEVNPAAVRIMGCQSPQELVGKHPAETSPPFQPNGESSAVMALRHIEECMTRGSARFDWVSQTPHGNSVPLEVALTRIEWSGRQVIQAFVTDISERKRAEEALREANRELHREIAQRTRAEESLKERVRISTLNTEVALALNARTELRAMLQQCAELVVRHLDVAFARVWILNEATQTLELQASAGCYTHLDGSHSRVTVGQYKIGLIAKEKKPHLTNSLQTDPRVSDKPWAAREGMVSFAGYPLLLEGRVLGVLAMFARRPLPEDVLKAIGSVADSIALGIERKRAQAALAESEARFSAAFHSSPAFINLVRMSDGQYVLANDVFLNFLGYPIQEVVGRTCAELGVWEDSRERAAVLHDMQTVGSIRQRECRWRNPRGERFTILLSAETIKLDDTPHILVMALDITQRKRAEEELLKTLAREKELSQLKSNFVSMVSHEFRTPLGIIQSSTELLRDFGKKMQPDERDEQLASIFRNTGRMAGLMEEVLVLSRLDAGKLIFQPTALDLNLFCRRVIDEVLSATSRRCLIEFSLASVPSEARADERLLSHIFTNLLSNAVKYSDAGATVEFTVARDGPDAMCVIRDRGIGISEKDQQQLFKAFHRGGNVSTRPGTGLGLLVVKRCADLHGGKVHVHSRLGEGTTVTIKLPVFGHEP